MLILLSRRFITLCNTFCILEMEVQRNDSVVLQKAYSEMCDATVPAISSHIPFNDDDNQHNMGG